MNDIIVPATKENIAKAAEIIKAGRLVAFPTETVYGLGANALDPDAVKRIYAAKGRPPDNPLILHVSGIRDAAKYGEIDEWSEALMQQFWPGPLTVVLYSLDCVPLIARGGLDTVALRMPRSSVALELIRMSGLPLAGPSANRSGRPSPTTALAVLDELAGAVDMILDDGPTTVGVESTVVDATTPTVSVLRPGNVTIEDLRRVVDVTDELCPQNEYMSPGTRYRHYAPLLPLILWDGEEASLRELIDGLRWCYMGLAHPPAGAEKAKVFTSIGEYARELYTTLRELENCGADVIVAELPQALGIGVAVKDRLLRAAGR